MPYLTPDEFQETFDVNRRDLATMILDEGLPVEHSPSQGLLIDEAEATAWLEDNGYFSDDDDTENDE